MSITSAMFTGVSGLLANAEGINVIGNNLANVNTVGFKESAACCFPTCSPRQYRQQFTDRPWYPDSEGRQYLWAGFV